MVGGGNPKAFHQSEISQRGESVHRDGTNKRVSEVPTHIVESPKITRAKPEKKTAQSKASRRLIISSDHINSLLTAGGSYYS
mmetsp:Transcript_30342/g.46439  ORF Transcript_30342/g.46439 Transcript_30342/m.46439 type:complete len:82 (+) Transcript_30342:317-562(+)